MRIVSHKQVSSVGEVDKYLNENGMSLSDVQITYTYNPRGSKYTIFFETEVSDRPTK